MTLAPAKSPLPRQARAIVRRTRGRYLRRGRRGVPDELRAGDLAAFAPPNEAVEFEALTDAEFVLGSAAPHERDLVLGYYSVHKSPEALRDGEAHISSIHERLVQEGRL